MYIRCLLDLIYHVWNFRSFSVVSSLLSYPQRIGERGLSTRQYLQAYRISRIANYTDVSSHQLTLDKENGDEIIIKAWMDYSHCFSESLSGQERKKSERKKSWGSFSLFSEYFCIFSEQESDSHSNNMHKLYTTLTVAALIAGVLDLVLNVVILTSITHKSFSDSVGLTREKAVVKTVTPTMTPPLVTMTATPSGTMQHSFKAVTPSVSPVPSHVILKK